MPRVTSTLNEIKEIHAAYEALVVQCRREFGSSVAEQQTERKRKRNFQKEQKRKAKKASASTSAKTDSNEWVTDDEEECVLVK